jgi:hypothetical protein
VNFLLPWCGVGLVYFLNKFFPTSFNTLFLINIWLFSLPHTFSTFSRSDRRSTKQIALTTTLILFFLISVLTVSNVSGVVFLYSVYFFWQQFHYGKQNFGLANWQRVGRPNFLDKMFYLSIVALSLVGLLSDGPQAFFGYALYSPFTQTISKVSIFSSMFALNILYLVFRPKQLVHALSHTLIFSFAYLYCEHFALGWLLMNVFHNLQYLKFMKSYEEKLSFLRVPLVLTLLLYILQFHVFKGLIFLSLPLGLSLMLALNFTHYTLDGLIWKNRLQT